MRFFVLNQNSFQGFKRNEYGFYSDKIAYFTGTGKIGVPVPIQQAVIAKAYSLSDLKDKQFDINDEECIDRVRNWTTLSFSSLVNPLFYDRLSLINNPVFVCDTPLE